MEQHIKIKEEVVKWMMENGFESYAITSYFAKDLPLESTLSVKLQHDNTIRISFMVLDDNESVVVRLYEGEQSLEEVKRTVEKVRVYKPEEQ